MKLRSLALLLATAAIPNIRYFRYERPVQNKPQTQLQTCVTVDPAMFEHSAPMLSDVRLYRDGIEAPYAIRVAAATAASPAKIAPLNLGTKQGRVVFDAEMPQGSYGDIELDLKAHDFIATVEVSGNHLPENTTQLGTFTVFDFTGQKLGRSTMLHLPQSDFRQLQFRITGPIKPEDVDGITVDRVTRGEPTYVTAAETSQMTQKGDTEIAFVVPKNVPIDRVQFVPGGSPANFSREVTMTVTQNRKSSAGDERAETFAYSGSILRFHGVRNGHRIDEERLSVDVPASTLPEPADWRVKIDNGDDPPLLLNSVKLQMLERRLCFDANPSGKYMLYYGDPALAAPRYDYATLFTPDPAAVEAVLGSEQENPEYRPRPDERPFTERHPALLWGALVVAIALLGGIALRSAKQVRAR